MSSAKAYKSYIQRQANKERLAKYNTPTEPPAKGLLAKRGEDKKSPQADSADITEYVNIIKEILGTPNEKS